MPKNPGAVCAATRAAALALMCAACTPQADQAPPAAAQTDAGMNPCELVTLEQVQTVLPGASPGTTPHSGGSLIEGIDAYQCSYVDPAGELLTVILNVARTPEKFAEIAPGNAVRENRRRVDVAQEGWLVAGADEVKLKSVQGLTVFDVDLLATEASGREAQLVELARAVAARLD